MKIAELGRDPPCVGCCPEAEDLVEILPPRGFKLPVRPLSRLPSRASSAATGVAQKSH